MKIFSNFLFLLVQEVSLIEPDEEGRISLEEAHKGFPGMFLKGRNFLS